MFLFYALVSVPQMEQKLVCLCAKPGYDHINNPDCVFCSFPGIGAQVLHLQSQV